MLSSKYWRLRNTRLNDGSPPVSFGDRVLRYAAIVNPERQGECSTNDTDRMLAKVYAPRHGGRFTSDPASVNNRARGPAFAVKK